MSIQGSNLKAIADAIREKDGTIAPIPADQFAQRILAIETGGLPDNVRTITLTADPPEGGTVNGGGVAQDGMNIIVHAFPHPEKKFDGWTELGEIVSKNIDFSFFVSSDRNLVANFIEKRMPEEYTEVEYLIFPAVKYTYGNCIPTDYYVEDTDRIEFEANFTYNQMSYDNNFLEWGAGNSRDRADVYNENTTNGYSLTAMYEFNNYVRSYVNILDVNTKVVVDFSAKKLLAYQGDKLVVNEDCDYKLYKNGPLILCGATNSYNSMSGKFFGAIIYRNGEKFAQYIPCKNSNGEVGVYEMIAQKFFSVTQIAGSPVTPGPESV